MNKKSFLSILVALMLCFTTVIPAATAPVFAETDPAVSGEEVHETAEVTPSTADATDAFMGEAQLLMSQDASLWHGDSWTADFNAEHACMLSFDLSTNGYYTVYYEFSLVNTDTNEVVYTKDSSIKTSEQFSDSIGLNPGNYRVTLTNPSSYSSRNYALVVSYQYLYTAEDPFYGISESEISLYTNRTAQLEAYALPGTTTVNNTVWNSSNPAVAAVDANGVVTGISAGTAVITANMDGNTVSCNVTVYAPEYSSLNYKAISLYPQQTQTLKLSVEPAEYGLDGLKWTSSNTKVATVNSKGVVTAKAKGTATITASVNGVKRTCKVTVKPMSISKQNATVYVKKTLKLTVNGGTGKATWKSGNKKVATVNANGVVKGIKPGTATITATKNGKKFKCKVTVKWEPETGKVTTTTYNVNFSESADINMQAPGKIALTITNTDSGDYADTMYVTVYNPKWNRIIDVSVAPGKTKTVSANTSARGDFYLSCSGHGKVVLKKTTKPAITKSTLKVGKGYTGTLKTVGVKNGGKWSSSNKKIATVNSKGVVKGKKKGTCYIKYTLKTGKVLKCKVTVVNPVTCRVTYVSDTSIYNECGVEFTNYTNKKITYMTLNITQRDGRGYKVKNYYDYDWFYVDDVLPANSTDEWEFWVSDAATKCTAYITKVWFADGTTWTP